MTPYAQGQHAAGVFLGITKVAVPLISRPAFWQRAGKTIKKWLPTWSGTKRTMVGEPGKFWNELVNRKALSKGSLVRQGFHAPGVLNKALFYGLPALDAVNVMRGDSPDKAGDIAGIIGGSIGGMAAYRPLGMLGAMAVGTAGSALGRGAVHGGKKLLGMPPAEVAAEQPQALPPYPQYPGMYSGMGRYPTPNF